MNGEPTKKTYSKNGNGRLITPPVALSNKQQPLMMPTTATAMSPASSTPTMPAATGTTAAMPAAASATVPSPAPATMPTSIPAGASMPSTIITAAPAPMPSAAIPRPTIIGRTVIICATWVIIGIRRIGIVVGRRRAIHVSDRRGRRSLGTRIRSGCLVGGIRCWRSRSIRRLWVCGWRRGRLRLSICREHAGSRLGQHRANHGIGNALLPQVNNLRGIQVVTGPGILDVSDDRGITNFGLLQLHDLVGAVGHLRYCICTGADVSGILRGRFPCPPYKTRCHRQEQGFSHFFNIHNGPFKFVLPEPGLRHVPSLAYTVGGRLSCREIHLF